MSLNHTRALRRSNAYHRRLREDPDFKKEQDDIGKMFRSVLSAPSIQDGIIVLYRVEMPGYRKLLDGMRAERRAAFEKRYTLVWPSDNKSASSG